MAIDLERLWDFSKPDVSAQRLKEALSRSTGDDALILHTQIARTHGLREDFDTARAVLKGIEPEIGSTGPEVRTRYHLEFGRTYASAVHNPKQLTRESREIARSAFTNALRIARSAGLDALAIDAIHMFAFLDTAPIDQLSWGRQALKVIQASSKPDAQRWEAPVRNNIGYALHQLGRYDEALEQFQQAARLRERGTNAEATRVAHWMVAWTLHSLGRLDEALDIQLRLERESAAAGKPDPYVFEELSALYSAKGNPDRAAHFKSLQLKHADH